MPESCHLCNKENAKSCCGNCKLVFYCDRQCQIKDWKQHKIECKKLLSQNKNDEKETPQNEQKIDFINYPFTLPQFNNELIRIEQIENSTRGYGMFANIDIKKGTIICKEKAMMVLPDYAKTKKKFYINQQFILLSSIQQNIYKSLSRKKNNDNNNDKNDQLLNIWQNNEISIPERNASAIFPLISRVNHCCESNSHWIWLEEFGEERLIALNDINKNTEITVNYCGAEPMNLEKRKSKLLDKWNINCECNWCTNDKLSGKMDKFIAEYHDLDSKLESMSSSPLDGYKASQKLIKIVEKYFNSNSYLISKHCYDAGQFALGLQKWSEASYYLETSFKEKQISHGNDIQITTDLMEKVNLLPTKFRSRFRKFDKKNKPKNKNAKNGVNNNKNSNDDEKKQEMNNVNNASSEKTKNGNKNKNNKTANNKTKNGAKSNGKTKNNQKHNKHKNKNKNKNKKKKTRK